MFSSSLYEVAFNGLPIGSYFLSPEPDPIILAVNETFLSDTDRTREELVGKRLFTAFPENPDDPQDTGVKALKRSIERVLSTGKPDTLPQQRYPIAIKMPDGTIRFEERFWNAINTPLFDRHGKLICVAHFTIDVTTQTRAEIAVQQSEERFRTLVTTTSQVVWTAEPNGEMRESPSWNEFTGQTHDQWKQGGWLQAIHPEDRERARSLWRQCVAARASHKVEIRVRRADGQYRWMSARAVPILNADGSVREWIGANRDITETKRAQKQLEESAERVRLATDAAKLGIWIWDIERNCVTLENPRLREMFGIPPSTNRIDALRFVSDFIYPPDKASLQEAITHTLESGNPLHYEGRLFRQTDHALRWFEVTGLPHYGTDGKPSHVIGTAADITGKKQVEEELQITHKRLNLAMEGAGEGVWEWDYINQKGYYAPQVKGILGYTPEELPDDEVNWLTRIHPEDRPAVDAALQECLSRNDDALYTSEYRVKTKDGDWRWVLSRGKIIMHPPGDKPARMVGLVSDISRRKEIDERIWQLANYDALSGLPNRRLFKERLKQEVMNAQRKADTVALFFIDLDRFKEVNDLSGHDVGDLLLVQAADRLKSLTRDTDTIARLGGDEFTVILPDLRNVDHVEQIAQKVLDALAQPFSINEESLFISGSIGIAIYPNDATSPEELISKADQAMYAAKHAGKNQFSYFTKEMDEKAHRRLRLIRELHHAVHAGQMKVHYQPVIDLHSGQIIKAEALVRWDHPVYGKVDPSYFIPLAEEGGMIHDIGNYVFQEAAATALRWRKQFGKVLQVSINKSPVQFASQYQDQWLSYLQQVGLSPSCVAVEITEGVLLHASDNVSDTLLEYRDAGIQVAIDDFGTGYSSMAYLQKFDIDYLKIDQSFTRDMNTNTDNRTIVESMVAMAHKLGLKVIAEGVETEEQAVLLRELGCDYAQGYWFSRPLSEEDFEALLIAEKPAASPSIWH